MMALYDLPAPAKLNLFLHVVGRRPDGYHLIQSVFELIDVCDILHIEKTASSDIQRSDDAVSLGAALPAEDLIVKAARLLQQASGVRMGAHIHLLKHIPMQAGMGGGSSDAATCLLALNQLWGLNWSRQALMQLGAQLGADVPFFLFGQHAWVEGIGEQLQAMPLPRHRYVVIQPPVGLATARIFSDPDLKRDFLPVTMRDYADSAGQNKKTNFCNCLEFIAKKQYPSIQHGFSFLENHQLNGKMTGSGSALFAEAFFEVNRDGLPPEWIMLKCESLDEHPLRHWVSH